jgi:acetylornithine deacetylase/succinyl-diaminopimelate desuccinylase-like protein
VLVMLSPDVERMRRDLAALVALDTQNPPGREAEAAGFVAALLAAEGLAVELDEYKPGRVNVIGRLSNGPGPVFAFNTHMDVVPVGGGWSGDPLRLAARDGRYYGRGTCDCKGPLAAMVEAIRMLVADRASWSGTLLAVFVADEEVASEGARRFAASRPAIDFAVVGEPTSNQVVIAHKGSLRPLVRVEGRMAHSSTPDLGENAIYGAARIVPMVEAFHRDVVRHRTHPLVGAASLTITRCIAGVADNVVPDRCDLLLDRRMVPGEDEGAARAEIEALVASAHDRLGVRASVAEYRPTTGGATEIAADRPIVRAALAASVRHGAAETGPIGFQGACDLVHFRGIGADGLVTGPGDLAVAHKPDEFVPVDEFERSSLIYRDIALAMLGSAR